jgi:hypothetical protein
MSSTRAQKRCNNSMQLKQRTRKAQQSKQHNEHATEGVRGLFLFLVVFKTERACNIY